MMEEIQKLILVAEDDEDDFLLISDALQEAELPCRLEWVNNGEELLRYLRSPKQGDSERALKPDLILLDLNMPLMDGREVLKELKKDPKLRKIPVVVFTTSSSGEDVEQAYDLGANSFIRKPFQYSGFINVLKNLYQYWFTLVQLPEEK